MDSAHTQAPSLFNNPAVVFEGWYWALPSRALKRGKAKPVRLCGRDLVLWRGADGAARAADAHCPHMGAHLALGRVEGESLRCFFHGWCFDGQGSCAEIPALGGMGRPDLRLHLHEVRERFGMIWVWVGDGASTYDVPVHPLLQHVEVASAHVASWKRACLPQVIMINAIDEHHFRTVHYMPGEVLRFETMSVARHQFRVFNRGAPPRTSWLWRLVAPLYRDENLYYEINYFYGAVGTVSLGPSWARLHLMFAVRPSDEGGAEGVTLALGPARKGLLGSALNTLVLWITALAGAYFAHGDAKVFETIQFDLKTPIPADRTVLEFVRHIECQRLSREWRGRVGAPKRAAAE